MILSNIMDLKNVTAILNFIGNLLGNAAIIALVPEPYKFWALAVGNGAHVILSYLANPTGQALGRAIGRG